MNLFGRYKKNKDYQSPLYQKHIAYAETDELKKVREQLDSVSGKFSRKVNLTSVLETIIAIISIVLVTIFISIATNDIAKAFSSVYVLFLVFGLLGIGASVFLFIKFIPGRKLFTNIKAEIFPVLEDIGDQIDKQLDFTHKDIEFEISIDVIEPVYGKIGNENKKPKDYNVDTKEFLIVNNRLLVKDGYTYLEIPIQDFRGVSTVSEKYILRYWPGDRAYNSKQYKSLKVRFVDGKFYLKSMGVMPLADNSESYAVTFMPYETGKAEYLCQMIERVRAGENIKDESTDLRIVGADFLNIQNEAVHKLKKTFGLKSGSKITVIGQSNFYFIEELLEHGFALDIIVTDASFVPWYAAELYGFENFKIMTTDEITLASAAEAELTIVSQYLLGSTSFQKYKELVLSVTARSKNVAAVTNRFGGLLKECALLKELDEALISRFDNYTPLGECEKVFEENLRSLGCLRGAETFRGEFPTTYQELCVMLDASFPKDMSDDEIKQIQAAVKEIFKNAVADELYEMPYETVVYTSNRGDIYR